MLEQRRGRSHSFLSPGQGGPKDGRDKRLAPARWLAKRDGEGVLRPSHHHRHRTLNRVSMIAVTMVRSAVATITLAM
jgi:hypothetical protein